MRIVRGLTNSEIEAIFGRTWGDYNEPIDFLYPDKHENWINIQHDYSLEIRMPRFVSAVQYMKFLKTFKKMFKALDTHYISKGAEHNVNHVRNAEKASRKMCAIFKKAYDIGVTTTLTPVITENDIATINVVENTDTTGCLTYMALVEAS